MKAWQVTRNAVPLEALRLAEVETPRPGPGQLLVRVAASALNFPDVLLCLGLYQLRPPLPFTRGSSCADTSWSSARASGAGPWATGSSATRSCPGARSPSTP